MKQIADQPQTAFWKAVESAFLEIDSALPSLPEDFSLACILAGGAAVHLYTQIRVSDDIDAEFSKRLLLPSEVVVGYLDEAGTQKWLALDRNYTGALGLMHPDYLEDAFFVKPIGNHLILKALSPVDLAVSKLARFQDHDRQDILALAEKGFFTADDLESRANEALDYCICPGQFILYNIAEAVQSVRSLEQRQSGRANEDNHDDNDTNWLQPG